MSVAKKIRISRRSSGPGALVRELFGLVVPTGAVAHARPQLPAGRLARGLDRGLERGHLGRGVVARSAVGLEIEVVRLEVGLEVARQRVQVPGDRAPPAPVRGGDRGDAANVDRGE